MVYNWLEKLQGLLFPPVCRLCGAPGDQGRDLCAGCHGDLPWLGSACPRCALPLPIGAAGCGQCQQRPPSFDRVIAPFRYAPPLDYLVQRLKFHQDLATGRLLGQLLLAHLSAQAGPMPDLILPVPLHRRRLVERGYNQALEIGRPLREGLGIPLVPALARRVRHAEAQSRLPAAARRRNLRGAYALGGAELPEHVAILDDVLTTGATADALARLLKDAGVARVEVWVVARTGTQEAGG